MHTQSPTPTSIPGATPVLPRSILDWVALFERLTPDDRPALCEHFKALGSEDRRLRFGLQVDDEFIERYVGGLHFGRDMIFGARSGPGQWLGIGHLVLGEPEAELGLSVLAGARSRGLGAAIFRFAVAHAARAGVERLYMHCLSTNRAVMSIARNAGMQIRSGGGETDAHLIVPPHGELARMLIGEPGCAAASAA